MQFYFGFLNTLTHPVPIDYISGHGAVGLCVPALQTRSAGVFICGCCFPAYRESLGRRRPRLTIFLLLQKRGVGASGGQSFVS